MFAYNFSNRLNIKFYFGIWLLSLIVFACFPNIAYGQENNLKIGTELVFRELSNNDDLPEAYVYYKDKKSNTPIDLSKWNSDIADKTGEIIEVKQDEARVVLDSTLRDGIIINLTQTPDKNYKYNYRWIKKTISPNERLRDILLPWIFPIIIVLFIFILFWITYKKINKNCQIYVMEIKSASDFLAKIEKSELVHKFGEIDNFFKNTRKLNHYWDEFGESLIKANEQIFNTIDAEHFFSAEYLVDEPLDAEFARHLPGVFTALGIVGTFLGIAVGLNRALGAFGQNINTSDLSSTTQTLLAHIAPAFIASLFAVGASVLFILLERNWANKLKNALNELLRNIDRLFPRKMAEDYLREILRENQEQTPKLKEFNDELANSIGTALNVVSATLNNTVAHLMENLKIAQKDMADSLGNSMVNELRPVSNNLKETMELIKSRHSDSTAEIMQQLQIIVQQFSNTLANNAGSQVAEMNKAISGTGELVEKIQLELHNFIDTLRKDNDSQFTTYSVKQAEMLEKLGNILMSTQTNMENNIIDLNQRINQMTSGMSENILGTISNSLERVIACTNQNIGNVTEVNDKALKKISSGVEQSLDKVSLCLENFVAASSQNQNEIKQDFKVLSELLATLTARTHESVGNLTQDLNEACLKVKDLTKDIVQAATAQQKQTIAYAEVSDKIIKTSNVLDKGMQNLEIFAKNAQQTSASLENISGNLAQQEEDMNTVISNLNSVSDKMSSASKSLGEVFNRLQANHKEVAESLKTYLAQFDQAIDTALSKINSTVEELTDNVESLEQALNRK